MTSRVRHDPASPLAGIKTTSRADHVLAKLEALEVGADDGLFLTLDGRVSETTSANIFVVRGDELLTPPLTSGVLAGTTRTWLLAAAVVADLALVRREVELLPEDVLGADEAFVSSSVAGILPIAALDGRSIGDGRRGRRTVALRESRERWIDEESLSARG